MKKILAVLLAASMLFAFAACGGNNEPETTTAAPAAQLEGTLEEISTKILEKAKNGNENTDKKQIKYFIFFSFFSSHFCKQT